MTGLDITTSVCDLGAEAGRLSYHGYDVADLAAHSTAEETAYVLLHGYLPDRPALRQFSGQLRASSKAASGVLRALRAVPVQGDPMSLLQIAVAAVGLEEGGDKGEVTAIHLVGQVAGAVAAIHRLRAGQRPISPRAGLGFAANLLYMMHGTPPDPAAARGLDVALILRADNELNPGTFAARVAASTGAPLAACIAAGLGALSGPRHGGHTRAVLAQLEAIGSPGNVAAWLDAHLAAGGKVAGFGHPVYQGDDPRVAPLRNAARAAAEVTGGRQLFETAEALEAAIKARGTETAMVDFYLAPLYASVGVPSALFPLVFAVSRVSGWIAHVLEQRQVPGLIRPRARYTGPVGLHYVPLSRR